MHELSIAKALVGLVQQHAPPGETVCAVQVTAGPLRAIEPQALQMAWQVATEPTAFQGAQLNLNLLLWDLHCFACGRQWQSDDLATKCSCGSTDVQPRGSDVLTLDAIEVEASAPPLPTPTTALQEVRS